MTRPTVTEQNVEVARGKVGGLQEGFRPSSVSLPRPADRRRADLQRIAQARSLPHKGNDDGVALKGGHLEGRNASSSSEAHSFSTHCGQVAGERAPPSSRLSPAHQKDAQPKAVTNHATESRPAELALDTEVVAALDPVPLPSDGDMDHGVKHRETATRLDEEGPMAPPSSGTRPRQGLHCSASEKGNGMPGSPAHAPRAMRRRQTAAGSSPGQAVGSRHPSRHPPGKTTTEVGPSNGSVTTKAPPRRTTVARAMDTKPKSRAAAHPRALDLR